MKLSAYLAIAGAVLVGQSAAAPLDATPDVTQHLDSERLQRREEKKGWTEEEKERLKHFHEPGYVHCPPAHFLHTHLGPLSISTAFQPN